MKIVVLSASQTDRFDKVAVAVKASTTISTDTAVRLVDATSFSVAGNDYLVAYFEGKAVASVLRIDEGGEKIVPAPSANLQLGGSWNLIETFVLGNQPHLLAYRNDKGIFNFFPILPDLTCPLSYRFFRNHDPGITAGFTTVKPFVVQGGVAYLGYNKKTGDVAMYTLSVTATSPPDVPPLLSLCIWSHKWAPGWTRFAFFQSGGENFFLKTNVDKENVNIDHVLDTLPNGTVEVGSQLDLADAQELSIVEPFTLANGDPYFITYRPDGQVTLNRLHGDGKSWSQVSETFAGAGVAQIVPVRTTSNQLFALFIPKDDSAQKERVALN